ncbi:hypothetical protein MUH86_003169 [Salmonella enterica]|nr:hypothetical protein [Salmonella enterica]
MADIPQAGSPCATCVDGVAIPFDIKPDNDPHPADERLSLDSTSVTSDWLFNNPWITEVRREQNIRDSFLLRVLEQFGQTYGAEKQAEMYAFLSTEDYQFVCLDDELLINSVETVVPGSLILQDLNCRVVNISTSLNGGKDIVEYQLNDNFLFADHNIYYATFTRACGEMNDPSPLILDWSVFGHFDIAAATQALKQRYEVAQKSSQFWTRFWGGVEAALSAMMVIPVVGTFSAAARGTIAAVRGIKYVFCVIDTALTVNMLIDGSSKLINGKGLDLGEALFKRIGELADPKDGAERGAQVFMTINLLMLAPLAGQAGKWALLRFPGTSRTMATYELSKGIEESAVRYASQGEAVALCVNFARIPKGLEALTSTISRIVTRIMPSLDTRNWFHWIEFTGGAAHVNLRAPSQQRHLALLIHNNGGSIRVAGRISKMVGNVREEIMARSLMSRYRVLPENILGYSRGQLGLVNKSGQGLDILVRVPPPPSLTLRTPATEVARNGIEGAHGTSATTTVAFQPDTLLVIEVKTTLGGQKTPGLSKATQQGGGMGDLRRIQRLINTRAKGWDSGKLQSFDPEFNQKLQTINSALHQGKIEFAHAQVFLRNDGTVNTTVGNGTGIQWNDW